jgi:hypothetical protein
MNPETIVNIYTVLVVGVIALSLWLTIAWMKKPKGITKLLSQSQENLSGLAAFMMVFCSIGLSIGFALSLSTSMFIGVLFVSLFTGFCIAEFTASFHLAKAWNDGRIGLVAASVFLLVGGAVISIIAGQALIATKVDEAQAKRLQASEAYQSALKERQTAQEQVKNLALDSSVVTQAQQQLAQFENQLANLTSQKDQALQVRDACPPDYLTKCIKPANQMLAALDSKINVTESAILKEKTILDQFEKYQHAQSYAAKLSNQPLPPNAVTDSVLPGIRALSIVLNIPTEIVGAHVFLFLAVFGELGGIILFYLWGASRLERAVVERTVVSGITIDGEFAPITTNPNHPELHQQLVKIQQAQRELEKSLAEQMALLEAKESTTTQTTSPKT